MKKKVINGFYYETFDEFKNSIKYFFENLNDYEKELERLLAFKFQVLPQLK
jgi:hypothetical protein